MQAHTVNWTKMMSNGRGDLGRTLVLRRCTYSARETTKTATA